MKLPQQELGEFHYSRIFNVSFFRIIKFLKIEGGIFLLEKSFNLDKIHQYVGDLSQIAGIKKYELKDGRAKGVEAFDVRTGAGLNYTVLADRGLDIAWTDFKGISLSYISNTGVVAPTYFEEEGFKSLRSLTLGLLTTMGLTYYGTPSTEDNEELGISGRIGNIPAEEICVKTELISNKPSINISGKVRQAKFFGEHLVMERKIKSYLGENKIFISSYITNEGFDRQPLMLQYHVNFGYPFLQEGTELFGAINDIIPRDEIAKKGLKNHRIAEVPQENYKEQVFYLDLVTDNEGYVVVALINEKLGIGIYEKFSKEQLPRFVQWKQMGRGFYVMALEPCTNYSEGRAQERKKDRLQYIEVGQTKKFELEIGVLDGKEEIDKVKEKISRLR